MTDEKSEAGDQRDALIMLTVSYQGARDITQEVLRIAFGNHFHATARPVWPQPFLSDLHTREKAKAIDRFLTQSKDVIRKVLKETNHAIDGLAASGMDISPAWIVADPLNGFLGALPITEIVQLAVEQDAEFESAIQSISKDLVVLNRKVKLATHTDDKQPTIDGLPQINSDELPLSEVGKSEEEAKFEEALLETCDSLKGQQLKLFEFLVGRKHKTDYGTLQELCWDKQVLDTSIQTALDRLAKSLNAMQPQRFSVVNEFNNRRAYIEPLFETKNQTSRVSTNKPTSL